MIDRDTPHVFTVRHQPAAPVGGGSIAAGCAAYEVSTDVATGASSRLVRFDPGWRFEGECGQATELFVLSGTIAIEGAGTLTAGGYAYVPALSAALRCNSPAGAEAFVFARPDASIAVDGILVRASFELPWESTVLPGFPGGAMHKSLRPHDATGAAHGGPAGFLRLVLPPPGWLSPHEERHPGCWEENILLRGDMLMPGRGVIRAGDCLANPAGHWHGPMVTKGGSLFLVNCDTPMGVEYRDHPAGPGELERYLETAPWE